MGCKRPAEKITSFSNKRLAEAADRIDRTRSLCEKSPPVFFSVSVAQHFIHAQLRR
jgi:hypothetical protein